MGRSDSSVAELDVIFFKEFFQPNHEFFHFRILSFFENQVVVFLSDIIIRPALRIVKYPKKITEDTFSIWIQGLQNSFLLQQHGVLRDLELRFLWPEAGGVELIVRDEILREITEGGGQL